MPQAPSRTTQPNTDRRDDARRRELLKRARARRALEERQAEHDLRTFIRLHQPQYRRPDHMAPLIDALDRSMRGPVFIALEAPPRHFKTSVIMAHIARLLRYRAGASAAFVTYANDIAFRRSRNIRDLAAQAGVWVGEEQKTAQRFDPSKSVAFWQTLQGGQFVAGGRHGQFIGEGFHFVAYDDPIKDAEESLSQNARDEAFLVLKGTLLNRLEPGGSFVIAHQRWNDDDPIGRLKAWLASDPDAPEFEIITLRAIEDIEIVTDEAGRERIVGGRPLCPWRYDLPALVKLASATQEFFWPQYQQDTRPRGTPLFPELPRYTQPHVADAMLVISCDPGISGTEAAEAKKAKPDPCGIVVAWARQTLDENGDAALALDVVWAVELHLDAFDLLDLLEDLQANHYQGAPVLLEEVSAFAFLGQIARRMHRKLDLIPVHPRGSKFLRSLPTSRTARGSRLRVPSVGAWIPAFNKQLRAFNGKPGGKDNIVDALTQLHDYCEAYLGLQPGKDPVGGESALAESPF